MKTSLKETLIRIIILLIGLVIAHFGVTLFLLANLGADPFNVYIQGLFRTLTNITNTFNFLTHGLVHMAICFLIIFVLLLVDKTYIKIGTLLCMFCGGPIIDFFSWLLSPVFAGDINFSIRILVNCLGCAILAYGMTIVIKSNAGTGPNDLVAIVISEKSGKKFSLVRITVDIFFALMGFIMGGTVGIGTIICAFIVGPVAEIFMPLNESLINKCIAKLTKNDSSS